MKRLFAFLLSTALSTPVFALPQDGTITHGDAVFNQSGNTLNVHQNSQQALIDWRTFNIGSNESVNFLQPNTSSLAINRVGHLEQGSASYLDGNLTANGRIWLFNPNGVIVGNGASFNTGSLVLSAGTFNDEDASWQAGPGSVISHGNLHTENDLTLLGSTIENHGTLNSNGGTIQLLAAQKAHVPLSGNGLITAAVAPATTPLKIDNTGAIVTPGGTAQLAMQAVDNPLGGILNTTGLIAANTVGERHGKIILGYAPQTTIGGTLSARGNDAGERGGTITATGRNVTVNAGTVIDSSGHSGGGTVNIGGNYQGHGPLANAQNTTIGSGATLSANALTQGNGGEVVVWSDNKTIFNGKIGARGGATSGNGGTLEVSGKQQLVFRGDADASAANGTRGNLLLDPEDIIIADGAGPEADDAEVGDGTIGAADGGAVPFTISEQALEGIAAGTDIHLEATRHITVNNLTDNNLNLATTGNVSFVADSDLDGTGNFSMNAGDAITTGGAGLALSGANLTLGNLDTSTGSGGAINLATTNSAGAINLGGTLNTGGAQGLTLAGNLTRAAGLDLTNVGAITLAGNSTMASGGGAITMDAANTINGAHTLGLNANTALTLGPVGNSTPLTALTASAGTNLTALGNLTTNGNVNLTAGTAIITPGSGSWQVASGGGDITLNSPLTLAANTTLDSGGGAITTGSINGAHALTLTSGAGNTTLNGAVGSGVALTSLAFTGNQLTTASGIRTSSHQTYGGAVQAQGTVQSTGGNLTFNDDLTLNGTTNLTATAGNINLNGATDGAHALTLTNGGTATINGIMGGVAPLASLAVGGASDVNANITTTGNQTFTGNTDVGANLSANTITTSGGSLNLHGNLTAADDITLGGTAITLSGNSALQSGGGTGNNITLASNVTGANTLALSAGAGTTSLQAVDVGTLTLTGAGATTLNGNVLTDTAQNWSNMGSLTLGNNVALTAGNGPGYSALTLGSGNTVAGSGHNLTLLGSTVAVGGAVTNVGTLAATGAGGINVTSNISTNSTQTYTGPLTLSGDLTTTNANLTVNGATTLADDVILNTGAGIGNVTLGTVDGAHALTLNAGTGTVTANDIGGLTPLTTFTLTANSANLQDVATTGDTTLNTNLTLNGAINNSGGDFNLNGALTTNTGATITAADDLTITGAATLNGNLALTSGGAAGQDITMGGGATGNHTLTLDSGSGDINLAGNYDLDSLTITSANDLNYSGGTIATDHAILFTTLSRLMLSGDTSIIATDGATRANVTMGSANTILATTPGIDLAVTGDIVTLYAIGDNGAGNLETLTIDANTAVMLGNVYTNGAQTITANEGLAGLLFSSGGDITLNTAATLVDDVTVISNGGNVYFNNILNGNHHLIVNADTGNIYLNADIGTHTPLASSNMRANRIFLNGYLTTQGAQVFDGEVHLGSTLTSIGDSFTFNRPVILVANSGLRTLGGGNITFGSTLDGTYDLTLSPSGGDIIAQGPIGATTSLGNLSITGAHNVTFNQAVNTTGYHQYGTTGTTDFHHASGLTTGDADITTAGSLLGRITGNDLDITAASWVGEVEAHSLVLATQMTNLQGTLGGTGGRQSTFALRYRNLSGGPHYLNGYALPLHELSVPDYAVADAILAHWDVWSPDSTPLLAWEDDPATPL